MNILYITDSVPELPPNSYIFNNTAEDIENLLSLYETINEGTIVILGLNKSPTTDKLLKLLEDNNKPINFIATTSTYDVKETIKSRFYVEYLNNSVMAEAAQQFLKTKKATKEQYSNLYFYVELSKQCLETKNWYCNMMVLNCLVTNIQLCTYNTPWDVYYQQLKDDFLWDN